MSQFHHRSRQLTWGLGLLVVLLSGCAPIIYRAETELLADGKIRRAVYQPIASTQVEALKPNGWERVTYCERIAHEEFKAPLVKLPMLERNEKREYFAAWGTFESPAKLPAAYRHQAPTGLPDGQLLVDYTATDCVLLVEHRWRETLTDIVTLDDMHLARQQFYDLMLPLVEQFFAAAFGEEYDTSGVSAWLRQTGKPWFFELTDVLFEAAARGEWDSPERMLARMEPVCARYRLKLRDAAGKFIEGDQARGVFEAYARRQLQDHLRRRDGEKVPDVVINDLLEWVGFRECPEEKRTEQNARFKEVIDKIIAQNYGSTEAFNDEIKPLLVRMLGLYAVEAFGSPRQFEYTMTMPGSIVETNGLLLSDSKVLWKFDASEAYPFGRRMECRALEVRADLVQKVFKNDVLNDRQTQLEFVRIAATNDMLKKSLQQCVADGSTDALYLDDDKLPAGNENRPSYRALLELFHLPLTAN